MAWEGDKNYTDLGYKLKMSVFERIHVVANLK